MPYGPGKAACLCDCLSASPDAANGINSRIGIALWSAVEGAQGCGLAVRRGCSLTPLTSCAMLWVISPSALSDSRNTGSVHLEDNFLCSDIANQGGQQLSVGVEDHVGEPGLQERVASSQASHSFVHAISGDKVPGSQAEWPLTSRSPVVLPRLTLAVECGVQQQI